MTNVIEKVNLAQKFSQFNDHWNPRIVGELNGQHVRLVKLLGEFTWHKHELEDEMFLVVNGSFIMELEQGNMELKAGEFIIIPKGVMHKPVAPAEVHIMLFEPASTINTGNAIDSELTRHSLQKI